MGAVERTKKAGKKRSKHWPRTRREHLRKHPKCAITGRKSNVSVHHKIPFHLRPDLELKKKNLITLSERSKVLNAHLVFGHLGNFRSHNANIEQDAKFWRKKFKTRPK